MSNGSPPNPALEAYKLEYQLASSRYENIYKAIWQIFSYLSAVTGALLTFGGDHFQQNLLWVLVSLPLLFWYFSTFRPMNRYGDLCLGRLVEIEAGLNKLSGSDLKHYTDFKEKTAKGPRVRHAVKTLFASLLILFVVNGYKTARAWCRDEPLIRPKLSETKPISLTVDELKKLIQQSPQAGQTAQEVKSSEVDAKKK